MSNDPTPLTRRRKTALLITALVYIGAAIVVYFTIDQAALEQAMALPASTLLAMLVLSILNYAIRAWRWLFLTSHLGIRVPNRSNCLYYFAGYALTATPGKAGEAVRLWMLKSGHQVGYRRSLPLMIADRMVDMWAIVVLVVASMSGFAAYRWQSIAMGMVIGLFSIPLLFPKLMLPLTALAYKWRPRHVRLIVKVRRIIRSLSNAISARAYVLILVPSVVGWLAEGAALYLVLEQFQSDVSLANAVFVFSFAMIVGALSMLPGGLGSTEATMVLMLKALGVDFDLAVAATAIVRVTTFWFAVVLGLACTPAAVSATREAARPAMAPSVGDI
jgi:glycosyltransferase 2 family protein